MSLGAALFSRLFAGTLSPASPSYAGLPPRQAAATVFPRALVRFFAFRLFGVACFLCPLHGMQAAVENVQLDFSRLQPTTYELGETVRCTLRYHTAAAPSVRISLTFYYKGKVLQSYTPPSFQPYPSHGPVELFFSIGGTYEQQADRVRITFFSADFSQVLYDKYQPVELYFGERPPLPVIEDLIIDSAYFGTVYVVFQTHRDYRYDLQRSLNMHDWQTVVGDVRGSGGTLYLADPMAAYFKAVQYRVVVRDP